MRQQRPTTDLSTRFVADQMFRVVVAWISHCLRGCVCFQCPCGFCGAWWAPLLIPHLAKCVHTSHDAWREMMACAQQIVSNFDNKRNSSKLNDYTVRIWCRRSHTYHIFSTTHAKDPCVRLCVALARMQHMHHACNKARTG